MRQDPAILEKTISDGTDRLSVIKDYCGGLWTVFETTGDAQWSSCRVSILEPIPTFTVSVGKTFALEGTGQ
jgi:hypothetical protein